MQFFEIEIVNYIINPSSIPSYGWSDGFLTVFLSASALTRYFLFKKTIQVIEYKNYHMN